MKQILTLLLFLSTTIAFTQENKFKENALQEFKREHYKEAILLLEKALTEDPNDAEIYYYLGFFNHYLANDSRPMIGYDYSHSNKIFEYLDKALELNPNYGDAKYFYGAECSANAFKAMQDYDATKLKYFYKLAYDKGAYPMWLVEFGKNFLDTCDEDAILFTAGNADFDICMYLQLHKNYRTDITIIPLGNINRPWYVQFLKNGLDTAVKKITMQLTNRQIMDMHPFKWDTTTVNIPCSNELKEELQLSSNSEMNWQVIPDLRSNRMHSKIPGERAKQRTYLSPQRAILLQITEDNFSERPIYFSNSASPTLYGGLDKYFQNCGMVSKLLPIKTDSTHFETNFSKLEQLYQSENFKDFINIKKNDLPRISGSVIYFYYYGVSLLVEYYKQVGKTEKLNNLIDVFNTQLKIGVKPNYEERIEAEIIK